VLDFLAALGGTTIAGSLLFWLGSKWAGSRIDASIKHEYDRLSLQYEIEAKRRERAQLVAELLAEWMATAPNEAMSSEQRKKLNRLSFEATLWLPEEIAKDLSRVLQRDPTAPSMFDLLLRTRTLLSGEHRLTPANVTQWGRDRELPNKGLPKEIRHGQLTVLDVAVEVGGKIAQLSSDDLSNLYQVPEEATVHFTLCDSIGEEHKIASPSIRSLQLVDLVQVSEDRTHLTLAVFPQAIANEINRIALGRQLVKPSDTATDAVSHP
jgi:hypothetical protein